MIKKKLQLGLVLLLSIFLISFVSASLGSFKQNECVNIRTILNTTDVNISTISSQDTLYISNQVMEQNGKTFNYTFCNTSQVGDYIYDYFDAEGNVYVNDFKITPSGFLMTDGASAGLVGSLLLMIIVAIVFFIIAMRSDNKVLKLSSYTFSIIIMIMATLYTVVIMQQTLFGFDSILSGIETFWFVMKSLLTIGIVAFIIILFLIFLKMWRIKRGLYDE